MSENDNPEQQLGPETDTQKGNIADTQKSDDVDAAQPPLSIADLIADSSKRIEEVRTQTVVKPEKHRGASPVLWALTIISLLVAITSLLINLMLVQTLQQKRAALNALLTSAATAMDNAEQGSISLTIPFEQTVDFEGDIPFQQDIIFPVKTSVHIDTTVRTPINLGALGTIMVNVPVNTTIPVDTEVPVHIDQKFHVKTKIPIKMNVPVNIRADQPPFSNWLESARQWLAKLSELLS